MAPKFGTSGLRGLVVELTDDLVRRYTQAFLNVCNAGAEVRVGWDLRPSSPDIAEAVIAAILATGRSAIVDGGLPTPALALAAMSNGQGAIMITGSHIPADRNGLKFYTLKGELSKSDEVAILERLEISAPAQGPTPRQAGKRIEATGVAIAAFQARYVDGFGNTALNGLRVGVYQHSSVARNLLVDVITALGGNVVALAWSDTFIPVDTEAVDPKTRGQLAKWCVQNNLDALVSTDGDADRPMVVDHTGHVIAGDTLGVLCAQMLKANVICTPVSSNTMMDRMEGFSSVIRTRIGSPFVIAAMEAAIGEGATQRVVGFEPNGGFLLGFDAQGPAGSLAPLMTRDCLLPILAPLYLAITSGRALADIVASLPSRFTATDRLIGIEPDVSGPFLERLKGNPDARREFFDGGGAEHVLDLTDGLRITFDVGDIVHLRPSGNAPEFRCYIESDSQERANALLKTYLERTSAKLS